ncbi:MAG: Mrp/NBP35 family ATP-binding protein [Actinomycetota bacterium]|nr:Mrp/NBP35 family ATP-binding protein [Actinomycetota bacterium]
MAAPSTTPLPTPDTVMELLRGVIDPELGSNIVELGMAKGAEVGDDGVVTVTVALTTAGCPLRAQIQKDVRSRIESHPAVAKVKINWTEMTQEEKSAAMSTARWNARERAPNSEIPSTTRVVTIASGKGGVGKSSVTVNLATALAARGFTVGIMDADIGGFSVPRMLGIDGRLAGAEGEKKMVPHEKPVGDGVLKVVSMRFLVDQEDSALMWRGFMLNRAVQHFVEDVRWGDMAYLFIDMPPGTGDVQMGLARMLPRAEAIIVTTPAVGAQKVAARAADMARKSYLRIAGVIENMSAFTCDHGQSYALFGAGGGEALAFDIGVPLLGQVPLEPAVSTGGDTGTPVALGNGPAAEAFHAIAGRIVDEAIPPVDMAGCTARLLDSVEAALGPKGA